MPAPLRMRTMSETGVWRASLLANYLSSYLHLPIHFQPLSTYVAEDIVQIPNVSSVAPSTTQHVLNACPTLSCQERCIWHHDSILKFMVRPNACALPEGSKLYADLIRHCACDNLPATNPRTLQFTSARPDLVLVDDKVTHLLELTIPLNSP